MALAPSILPARDMDEREDLGALDGRPRLSTVVGFDRIRSSTGGLVVIGALDWDRPSGGNS